MFLGGFPFLIGFKRTLRFFNPFDPGSRQNGRWKFLVAFLGLSLEDGGPLVLVRSSH